MIKHTGPLSEKPKLEGKNSDEIGRVVRFPVKTFGVVQAIIGSGLAQSAQAILVIKRVGKTNAFFTDFLCLLDVGFVVGLFIFGNHGGSGRKLVHQNSMGHHRKGGYGKQYGQ